MKKKFRHFHTSLVEDPIFRCVKIENGSFEFLFMERRPWDFTR